MDLTHSQIDDLFSSFSGQGAVGLAVSGGGDSMALMHLFAEWRKRFPLDNSRDVVFSVDHGVREGAAEEVQMVLSCAEELGFVAVPLKVGGLDKGASLQERARRARYEVIASEMKVMGLSCLLTAHTLDDQAETFLMRLRRGSGIDGLSSMFPRRELYGVQIMRPLLSPNGQVLRKLLKQRGVSWVEDPSNENEDFERVEVRNLLKSLDVDGRLSEMIGQTVCRLQRGRIALEDQALGFIKTHLNIHRIGVLQVKLDDYFELPLDVQIRVLRRVLLAFGAEGRSLSSLEGGAHHLASMREEKFVLAGVMCEKRMDGFYQFSRESGRAPFEIIERDFGTDQRMVIWDNRIRVMVPEDFKGVLKFRGFTKSEISQLAEKYKGLGQAYPRFAIARSILPSVVGVWSEGQLLAVPQLESYDESLFVELFGDLDRYLDEAPFDRAVFPLNGWMASL